MIKVGITERGDAGIDFSWVDKLLDANIIISKNLNNRLIEELLNHKEKIIFHMTCTGYGETVIEPNVNPLLWTRRQAENLIDMGFPIKQIVLRVDPIIPTEKGIYKTDDVLDCFKNVGIKRLRYSFLDIYPHVKQRFEKSVIKIPYSTFTAPQEMINNALEMLDCYKTIYEFESCAEKTPHQLGCISQKDFDILGITDTAKPAGFQRSGCMCIAGKTELLNSKTRCPHRCLYCYWKD